MTSSTDGLRWKRAVCVNPEMADTIREQILTYHNEARRRVAKGVEPNKSGLLNPAMNMYKLEWDCAMELQAQEAVSTCSSSLGSWSGMAQNLISWTSSAGFSNPASKINSSISGWWGKAQTVGVTDPDNKYTNSSLYNFANVSEVTLKNGYYTNAAMWRTGPACSIASDCTTYANSQCDNGLCVKGEPIPETNNVCSSNEGMTDSVRQKFLELHNGFRSSLARGLEPDALGGFAPKAKKMLKMVYDCSVEASALRHANKCVYQHSASSDRAGLGENIYKTTRLNYDKVKAATQMAWETSYRLGCAIAHCPSFTFGVCQYGPPGNYLNRLIYTIGDPCTSDSGCPGSYTCNAAEGLCNVV
ncbi:unnamed protein product [Heligmosomoides polygyrus]|uniref:SCP domain-containing protein n=1 Tax=Heligmosomoides polygyrus TaxID=6339 RepID=A0A3P8C833_HELPZ|nr:unnamed protein product [Heligmosomoides polygyrus]